MEKYVIKLEGCDDSTYIHMKLTEKEVELIDRLSKESIKTSSCSCQPTLTYFKGVLDNEG